MRHFRMMPFKLEAELLRRIEQAKQSQSGPATVIPIDENQNIRQPIEQAANPSLREPSKDAFAAYRLSVATGKKQAELAELLTSELRKPVSQGQISRWLTQVAEWIEAGNVLPDIPGLSHKPTSIDPTVIDGGERQDGRTPRQRPQAE